MLLMTDTVPLGFSSFLSFFSSSGPTQEIAGDGKPVAVHVAFRSPSVMWWCKNAWKSAIQVTIKSVTMSNSFE